MVFAIKERRMKPRTEIIGNQRLILGDCMEILPGLGPVDHIIIACRRVEAAAAQPDMFRDAPPRLAV